MKKAGPLTWFAYLLILLYLGIPLVGTLLFSLSTRWDSTILPEGYTLNWYRSMLAMPELQAAVGRSFLVSSAAVLLSLLTVTPAAFVVYLYYPRLMAFLRVLALMPYALPGVILAVGLIRLYSGGPIRISGTFWILLFAYVVTCLPYTYTALINGLQAIDARRLVEAAQSLGASRARAFLSVILPNMRAGVLSAALLSFSVALGEFVLANMLVGGRFMTLQVLLDETAAKDGRISSAMVMLYFVMVAVASFFMLRIVGRATQAGARPAAGTGMGTRVGA